MIIVNTHGRMGNQYFQYAFARNLQEKIKEKYKINNEIVMNFDVEGDMLSHTKAEFTIKNIKPYLIQRLIIILNRYISYLFFQNEALKIKYSKFVQPFLNFCGIYYSTVGFVKYKIYKRKYYILDGYFQAEQYFINYKNQIKKELQNKKENISKRELNSVCIHIRRGDYTEKQNERYLICSLDYYKEAINYFKESKYKFYIFSDDIDWCKKNLQLKENTVYEKKSNKYFNSFEEMYCCDNFILSNSSFSWWAQYLSEKPKTIIAPGQWNKETENKDIYLNNWTILKEEEHNSPFIAKKG